MLNFMVPNLRTVGKTDMYLFSFWHFFIFQSGYVILVLSDEIRNRSLRFLKSELTISQFSERASISDFIRQYILKLHTLTKNIRKCQKLHKYLLLPINKTEKVFTQPHRLKKMINIHENLPHCTFKTRVNETF